ncbi:hypothetical protein ACHAWF_017139, partial [Thalassiosira exigua]
ADSKASEKQLTEPPRSKGLGATPPIPEEGCAAQFYPDACPVAKVTATGMATAGGGGGPGSRVSNLSSRGSSSKSSRWSRFRYKILDDFEPTVEVGREIAEERGRSVEVGGKEDVVDKSKGVSGTRVGKEEGPKFQSAKENGAKGNISNGHTTNELNRDTENELVVARPGDGECLTETWGCLTFYLSCFSCASTDYEASSSNVTSKSSPRHDNEGEKTSGHRDMHGAEERGGRRFDGREPRRATRQQQQQPEEKEGRRGAGGAIAGRLNAMGKRVGKAMHATKRARGRRAAAAADERQMHHADPFR